MRKTIINNSSRMTITNISQDGLGAVKIPIPSIEEQREIGEVLTAQDNKIATSQYKKDILSNLFKTMLHELMTGSIRTTGLA
jgi:type I restriction enzyme, S subunit